MEERDRKPREMVEIGRSVSVENSPRLIGLANKFRKALELVQIFPATYSEEPLEAAKSDTLRIV
jgi:hypothetical protein